MDNFKVKNMIFIKGGIQYELQSFYTRENLDGQTKIHTKVKMMIYVPVNSELQPEANIWKTKKAKKPQKFHTYSTHS